MGHANLQNISELFVGQLREKGEVTIREVTALAVERHVTVNASEGPYDDPSMIGMALEQVVAFLRGRKPVIEPVELSPDQSRILDEWDDEGERDMSDWDDEDYEILDSIRWRIVPSWSNRMDDIPILRHVTN